MSESSSSFYNHQIQKNTCDDSHHLTDHLCPHVSYNHDNGAGGCAGHHGNHRTDCDCRWGHSYMHEEGHDHPIFCFD